MPSDWSQDLYIKAYRFAAGAHWKDAQVVPGTNIPYLMHFSLVAMEVIAALVIESNLDGNLAVQCALLHDTVEDAGIKPAQLAKKFNRRVADGVVALTKDKTMETDSIDKWKLKKLRMTDSLERLKAQPREIWMVKLADRITNLQPPPHDWTRKKVEMYKKESVEILETLKDSSDFLAKRLQTKINSYRYQENP